MNETIIVTAVDAIPALWYNSAAVEDLWKELIESNTQFVRRATLKPSSDLKEENLVVAPIFNIVESPYVLQLDNQLTDAKANPQASDPTQLTIPILMLQSGSDLTFDIEATSNLARNLCRALISSRTFSLRSCLRLRGLAHVTQHRFHRSARLLLEVAVPDVSLAFTPVGPPADLLHTPLAAYLTGASSQAPTGSIPDTYADNTNAEHHPMFGYLVYNQTRKLVSLEESHPALASVNIAGVWLYLPDTYINSAGNGHNGMENNHNLTRADVNLLRHPLCWGACARYLLSEKLSRNSQCFLLALFTSRRDSNKPISSSGTGGITIGDNDRMQSRSVHFYDVRQIQPQKLTDFTAPSPTPSVVWADFTVNLTRPNLGPGLSQDVGPCEPLLCKFRPKHSPKSTNGKTIATCTTVSGTADNTPVSSRNRAISTPAFSGVTTTATLEQQTPEPRPQTAVPHPVTHQRQSTHSSSNSHTRPAGSVYESPLVQRDDRKQEYLVQPNAAAIQSPRNSTSSIRISTSSGSGHSQQHRPHMHRSPTGIGDHTALQGLSKSLSSSHHRLHTHQTPADIDANTAQRGLTHSRNSLHHRRRTHISPAGINVSTSVDRLFSSQYECTIRQQQSQIEELSRQVNELRSLVNLLVTSQTQVTSLKQSYTMQLSNTSTYNENNNFPEKIDAERLVVNSQDKVVTHDSTTDSTSSPTSDTFPALSTTPHCPSHIPLQDHSKHAEMHPEASQWLSNEAVTEVDSELSLAPRYSTYDPQPTLSTTYLDKNKRSTSDYGLAQPNGNVDDEDALTMVASEEAGSNDHRKHGRSHTGDSGECDDCNDSAGTVSVSRLTDAFTTYSASVMPDQHAASNPVYREDTLTNNSNNIARETRPLSYLPFNEGGSFISVPRSNGGYRADERYHYNRANSGRAAVASSVHSPWPGPVDTNSPSRGLHSYAGTSSVRMGIVPRQTNWPHSLIPEPCFDSRIAPAGQPAIPSVTTTADERDNCPPDSYSNGLGRRLGLETEQSVLETESLLRIEARYL